MSGTVEFDEATHTYRLNGRVFPSVTQVIHAVLASSEGFASREFYRDRGEAVHIACRLYARGTLDESTVDENVRPYLEAYKRFLRQTGFKPAACEARFADERYGFAGTLDQEGRWGSDDGPWTVIELKSGAVPAWTPIQLAAYCMARGRGYRAKRIVVNLLPDATYKLLQYPLSELSRDWSMFVAALAVYTWRKVHGYID